MKGLKVQTKETLECVVCLNQFEDDELLRLLPKCSHAFHPDCIDTWLFSHTTCLVCRIILVPILKLVSLYIELLSILKEPWPETTCVVWLKPETAAWTEWWSIGDCVESLRAWESWSSELYWIYMPLIVDATKLILILRWRLNEDFCVKTETVTVLEIEWRLLREDRDFSCELRIHERLLMESLLSVYFRDLSLVNIGS